MTDDLRERVARVIDPHAWATPDASIAAMRPRGVDATEYLAHKYALKEIERKISLRRADAAIAVCWQEINSMIVSGELPGNGTDKAAQRNGLVLAANALAAGRARENG